MKLVGVPDTCCGESPASWLTRAALSQAVNVPNLKSHLGVPTRCDPDITVFGGAISKISRVSGLPASSFALAEHIFAGLRSLDPLGHNFLLWTEGRKARYRYCPLCLEEPGCKFFPLHWRFKAWRWCPVHDCLLEDVCAHCSSPVILPDTMINAGPDKQGVATLQYCLQCANPLYSGLGKILHPVADNLLTSAERVFLMNGRAVLAALLHRAVYSDQSDKRRPLTYLETMRKFGVLPHEYFEIPSYLLEKRLSQRL